MEDRAQRQSEKKRSFFGRTLLLTVSLGWSATLQAHVSEREQPLLVGLVALVVLAALLGLVFAAWNAVLVARLLPKSSRSATVAHATLAAATFLPWLLSMFATVLRQALGQWVDFFALAWILGYPIVLMIQCRYLRRRVAA